MKKIGKKLNYITKVFLALGLLSSNMIFPLKTVFAYEGEENNDTVINENVNEQLEENENEDEKEIVEDETDEEELDEEGNKETELDETEEENSEEDSEEENEEIDDEEETNDEEEVTEGENTEEENSEEELVEENNEEETTEENDNVEYDYTKELNDSAKNLGLDIFYIFSEWKVRVVDDIYDFEVEELVNDAFEEVTYEIADNKLILTDGDKKITYDIVIYNEEFMNELMKRAVGNGEATDDYDIDGDGKVDSYDVHLLKEIGKYGMTAIATSKNVTVESKFDGDVSNLIVGDTFTVQYVLTLSEYAVDGITGLIKYNKDILSLDNVEVRNFEIGENYEGRFLYFGDALRGKETVVTDEDGNELTTYEPTDYVVVVMTFTAKAAGNDNISIEDIGYFYDDMYYEGNTSGNLEVNVTSPNNRLSSVTIAGQEITIDELTDIYSITVGNDVTSVDLEYILADESASITSIVAPEELAVGENVITITVMAETGEERTYTFNVTREEETTEEEKEEVAAPVNYQDTYNDYNDNKTEDKKAEDKKEDKKEEKTDNKEESKLSKGIIIALILLAVAGLIYLIFKDDDDEETKKANKEVDKLKKEELKEVNSKKEVNNKKTKKKER